MSTKCTIRYGKRWHLYQECLEDDAVYLELEDVEFNASADTNNSRLIIRLDNELAVETGIIAVEEKPQPINWDNFGKNVDKLFKNKEPKNE